LLRRPAHRFVSASTNNSPSGFLKPRRGELSGNPALALPVLFAGGVLTSLTPCVYPMIPITAAIVGGSQAGATGSTRYRRSF